MVSMSNRVWWGFLASAVALFLIVGVLSVASRPPFAVHPDLAQPGEMIPRADTEHDMGPSILFATIEPDTGVYYDADGGTHCVAAGREVECPCDVEVMHLRKDHLGWRIVCEEPKAVTPQ